ncbi:MAG: nucleotidyltransferase family protein [Candidatus Omnitrophica bacterium]|nr:nucleotidyltransferase family protein [Candidatus Omnitrophota bacterium]
MKAILLAAGYATRLYPLTLNFPKALLPINCVPVINIIIHKLELIPDINEIIVVTNNRFHTDFKNWAKEYHFKKKVTILNDKTASDEDKLGAIADLGFVIDKKNIKEDIVIIGADNLFDAKLGNFIKWGRESKKICVGLFDFKKKTEVTKYGVVRIGRNRKITNFQEKPRQPKSTLVAMCLYYFPKGKGKIIDRYLRLSQKKDAVGHYISWLVKKGYAYGWVFNGRWFDIGDKKQYFKANKTFQTVIHPDLI